MFGHVERPAHWARHLLRAREQQARTGGFTELVPLPFVPMEAPIFLQGPSAARPRSARRCWLHAVARLALHPLITNGRRSWVKLGPDGVRQALAAGVNDLGGTLMNESISRAAGSEWGQELPPEKMEELIRSAGRTPRQRTTTYGEPPTEQVRRSFGAAPLAEPLNPPVRDANLRRPSTLLRPAGARRLTSLVSPRACDGSHRRRTLEPARGGAASLPGSARARSGARPRRPARVGLGHGRRADARARAGRARPGEG